MTSNATNYQMAMANLNRIQQWTPEHVLSTFTRAQAADMLLRTINASPRAMLEIVYRQETKIVVYTFQRQDAYIMATRVMRIGQTDPVMQRVDIHVLAFRNVHIPILAVPPQWPKTVIKKKSS